MIVLTGETVLAALKDAGNSDYARHSLRFFKTGKGEYGEGDLFLGIRVPEIRKLVKKYINLDLVEAEKLLSSEFHEIRLFGFLFLAARFKDGNDGEKKTIYELYLENKKWVNNWDIVDTTAPKVVGKYLLDKDKSILYDLSRSESLWERRIAILSTFAFIKSGFFKDTLRISEILLKDKEDLIHKAVGWMLREVGKRSAAVEEDFLQKYYPGMPRTMLRYAIERFDENRRQEYLKGTA